MKFKGVFLAAVLTAVICISGNVLAVLSGGGTSANPYLIQSRADFDTFANPANAATYWSSGKYTKLMCNLNLSGTTYTQAPIAGSWESFAGFFDGNGHTISNLAITPSTQYDNVGLFGNVSSGGQIRNLGVENVNLTGAYYSYVGGLAGYNGGSLTSCYATGSVDGISHVGGLVGYNEEGVLNSCYASVSVNGEQEVGGLVGTNVGALITLCHATGSVSGTGSYVGGLVGESYGGSTISRCYSTGSVTGTGEVGGLAGYNGGSLTSCYATGNITGTGSEFGGLAGYNSGVLTSCYASGSVSVAGTYSAYAGGLVGWNPGGIISNCYSIGSVSGMYVVGGLVAWSEEMGQYCEWVDDEFGGHEVCKDVPVEAPWLVENSFWDMQTSGQASSSGGAGMTTAEMKQQITFAGWNFTTGWMMLRPGEDYPRLAWQPVILSDITGLYGVNSVDFAEIAAYWRQTGCPSGCANADINNDGTVDMYDLMLLGENWLEGI
jgi:hypothetical protein